MRYLIDGQKKLADLVLSNIEIIDPNAIIAGGAPRDWALGTPANDIDIYFYSTSSCHDMQRQIGRATGITVKLLGHKELDGLYESMDGLMRVFEGELAGVTFQFMQMKEVVSTFSVVDNFSTSICKAWRKDGRSVYAQPFLITLASGVMYLSSRYKWTDKHPDKMFKRFCPMYKKGTESAAINIVMKKGIAPTMCEHGLRDFGFNGAQSS